MSSHDEEPPPTSSSSSRGSQPAEPAQSTSGPTETEGGNGEPNTQQPPAAAARSTTTSPNDNDRVETHHPRMMSKPPQQQTQTTSPRDGASEQQPTEMEEEDPPVPPSSFFPPNNDDTATTSSTTSTVPKGTTSTPQHRRRPRSRAPPTDTASSSAPSSVVPIEPSIVPDWLTSSALHGTLDVLKLLGTTTGKLAAPPWHVTRTVLLPQLLQCLVEVYQTVTPPRFQDWSRLIATALQHCVHTVLHTESGRHVQQEVRILGAHFVDCWTTDSVQQVWIDALACMINILECAATPEFAVVLQQGTRTAQDMIRVVADHTGQWMWLCHCVRQCVTSVVQWGNDPETVTALAEVVAQFCYALEMEQQQKQYERRQQYAERNEYQKTMLTRDTLPSQTDVTVEEAILSSLGCTTATATTEAAAGCCIPESIEVNRQQQQQNTTTAAGAGTAQDKNGATLAATDLPPPQQQQQQQTCHDDRTVNKVDVDFLRDGIQQRAFQLGRRRQKQHGPLSQEEKSLDNNKDHPGDDVEDLYRVVTVENDDDDEEDNATDVLAAAAAAAAATYTNIPNLNVSTLHEEATNPKTPRDRPTLRLSPSNIDDAKRKTIAFRDEIDPWYQQQSQPPSSEPVAPSLPLEGESSKDHFQRLVHELLTQKRRRHEPSRWVPPPSKGVVVRRPDTLPRQFQDRDWNRAPKKTRFGPSSSQDNAKKKRLILYGVIACSVWMIFVGWAALGCYGLYTLWNRHVGPSPMTTEIVIRVVHDDPQFPSIAAQSTSTADEGYNYQQIAQCVANVVAPEAKK